MDKPSIEEKIQIVRLYSANSGNVREVRRKLYQRGVAEGKWSKVGIEKAPTPSHTAIDKINKTFDETGCVDRSLLKVHNRVKTVVTQENMERVADEVLRSPRCSEKSSATF